MFLAGAVASAQTVSSPPSATGGQLESQATGGVPVSLLRQITALPLQEAVFQNYTNGDWVDFSRARYSRYSAPLLPGLIETDRRTGTTWTLASASHLRYNSAGLVLTDTIYQFQQPTFGPFAVLVNTYNTPTQVRWEWTLSRAPGSAASVPFDSTSRSTHTYNAAGQLTQVLHQFYAARTYLATSRDLYTYNAQNLVSIEETQNTLNNGATWVPSTRSTTTYTATGKVQQVINETAPPTTGVYANSTRDTYQYDAQDRPSVVTTDKWVNNAWALGSQNLYAYNAAGDIASLTSQDWTGSAFVNVSRVLFNYQQVTSSRGALAHQRLAVVPNPSEAGTQAQILLETGGGAASGAVFDQLGRQVAVLSSTPAQALRGTLALPANLPAGLYLVHLRAGSRQWQARWQQL
ncbi:hypothetical protein GCM10028822_36740 [Hymenobacter terrigena]